MSIFCCIPLAPGFIDVVCGLVFGCASNLVWLSCILMDLWIQLMWVLKRKFRMPRAEIQKKASCCHPPLLFLPVWSENFGAWLCGCCAFGSQNEFIPLVYRVFCDALGFALSHCCVFGWRLVVLILHFWCLGGHALLWMSRNLGPFLLASGLWSSTGTKRPSMGSCKMVTRLGERFLPTLVMLQPQSQWLQRCFWDVSLTRMPRLFTWVLESEVFRLYQRFSIHDIMNWESWFM